MRFELCTLLHRSIIMYFSPGKIYSVLGALESATQTLSSPLYSLLYNKTVATMPDAWLIPGIALAALQSLAYVTTRKLRRSQEPATTQEKYISLEKIDDTLLQHCNEKVNESKKPSTKIEESK